MMLKAPSGNLPERASYARFLLPSLYWVWEHNGRKTWQSELKLPYLNSCSNMISIRNKLTGLLQPLASPSRDIKLMRSCNEIQHWIIGDPTLEIQHWIQHWTATLFFSPLQHSCKTLGFVEVKGGET